MMANKEEGGEGNASRGNEWEVVSLTASTYAAAPGPGNVELQDNKRDGAYGDNEAESSRPSIMSEHFIFQLSQHENLPLQPDNIDALSVDTLNEQVGKNVVPELGVEKGIESSRKDEEDWPLMGLNVSEEIPGLQFVDGKAVSASEFEESTTLQELGLNEKEQSMYNTDAFTSFPIETGRGESDSFGENLGIADVNEHSEQEPDFSTDISQSPKVANYDGSNLPCEAWWKRRAASLYSHAKEANAFWSIFVAAAVMGLVVIGQRWQHERWQALQLKWQFNINEKTGRMLGPISRLKNVIVGRHQCGSLVRVSSSSQN